MYCIDMRGGREGAREEGKRGGHDAAKRKLDYSKEEKRQQQSLSLKLIKPINPSDLPFGGSRW